MTTKLNGLSAVVPEQWLRVAYNNYLAQLVSYICQSIVLIIYVSIKKCLDMYGRIWDEHVMNPLLVACEDVHFCPSFNKVHFCWSWPPQLLSITYHNFLVLYSFCVNRYFSIWIVCAGVIWFSWWTTTWTVKCLALQTIYHLHVVYYQCLLYLISQSLTSFTN